MEDRKALRATYRATMELYAAISFGCGQVLHPKRLRACVLPGAVLVNNTEKEPDLDDDNMTPEQATRCNDGFPTETD